MRTSTSVLPSLHPDSTLGQCLHGQFRIVSVLGFGFRNAARMAQTIRRHQCSVFFREPNGGMADGRSVLGLAIAASEPGRVLQLTVTGPDAQATLSEIRDILREGLGEWIPSAVKHD